MDKQAIREVLAKVNNRETLTAKETEIYKQYRQGLASASETEQPLQTSKQAYRDQQIERAAKVAYKAVAKLQGNKVAWLYASETVKQGYRVAAEAILVFQNVIQPRQ